MISYSKALEDIHDLISPLGEEHLRLEDAGDRIGAEAMHARDPVPPFANAAMDGFALQAADTAHAGTDAPVRMAVAGRIAAGEPPAAQALNGQAWEIMTGAPLPSGCDAVAPLERVEVEAGGERDCIRIAWPVKAGQNVRNAGEDMARGQEILSAGNVLTPAVIMGLAAAGVETVAVRSRPRVAVIVTGREVGASGAAGIHDANGPYLRRSIAAMGAELMSLEHVGDQQSEISRAIAAAEAEVVITTGGVSAGAMDLVPGAVAESGGEILFHKLKLRPGKPALFARRKLGQGDQWLFGLPGNPIAVAVGLRFLVSPGIDALTGRTPEQPLRALLINEAHKRAGLRFFGKARYRVSDGAQLAVELLPGQESFKIAPLIQANCWLDLPEEGEGANPGDLVHIWPLKRID